MANGIISLWNALLFLNENEEQTIKARTFEGDELKREKKKLPKISFHVTYEERREGEK